MFGWKGALTAEQTARDRRRQAGDLRRLQGRRRGRRAEGEGRHPGGRAVRRRHPARRRGARLHHRVPRREERAGRVRLRVRRGLRQAHRGVPPDFLQGAGALQPGGRQGPEPAAGGPAEAAVRLPARQEPQPVHVRAAGAAGEGAARHGSRATRRPTTCELRPRTDGAGDPANCRTRASSRTSGRSRGWTAARTARRSWPRRGGAAATRSAASSWAAARTTRRCASG